MKKLNEIFDTNIDVKINDVKTNTKDINPGDLFVCIKGVNVDRHDFVKDAEEKGASALVVERNVDSSLPQIIVDNTNKELISIADKVYDYPQNKLTLIGVTGTDGKTSTSTILYQLINQFDNCGYIGTNGVNCKNYTDDTSNTTPTPEHLRRFFKNFLIRECKYVAMETSSEAMAQGRTEGLEYEYSIFTNLSHEHLNYHKTMENYLDAKKILFNQTKKEGYAFINLDDNYAQDIIKDLKCNLVTYGKNEACDVRFLNENITNRNTEFDIKYNNNTYHIVSPLLGLFNVYNLTAALSVLLKMDVDINKLDFSNLFVEGRVNSINEGQNFNVIVDYAHTPNGYLNLFSLVKTIPHNRIISVAGSAGERDHSKRPTMGKVLTDNSDLTIFTYEDPRSEDPSIIIDELAKNVLDDSKYLKIVDRKQAIKKAISLANENDIVLILGKGNENYEILNTGKIHFNDIEEARNALKELN